MKEAVTEKVNGANIVGLYDITIPVTVNGEIVGDLSKLSEKIELKLPIPEGLPEVSEGYNRVYYVVKEHNGEIELLNAIVNSDNTVSFETDEFSRYALAYVDEKNETPNQPQQGENEEQNQTPEKDETPKTGITTYTGIAGIVVLAAFVGNIFRRFYMIYNKKIIKIISFCLIFLTIFTFSVVLATDETLYVWSSETEPLSTQTSTGTMENSLSNNIGSFESETTNAKNENQSNGTTQESSTNSLNLESGGAILIEQKTGEVLYEHNPHEQLRPASVTKVMSLLLIMEALDSGQIALTDKVPCTEDAAGMGGSQIWLEVGEELTVDEMLKAICVVSANDCTEQFRHL